MLDVLATHDPETLKQSYILDGNTPLQWSKFMALQDRDQHPTNNDAVSDVISALIHNAKGEFPCALEVSSNAYFKPHRGNLVREFDEISVRNTQYKARRVVVPVMKLTHEKHCPDELTLPGNFLLVGYPVMSTTRYNDVEKYRVTFNVANKNMAAYFDRDAVFGRRNHDEQAKSAPSAPSPGF